MGADGRVVRRFAVGDAVEAVQTVGDDATWVCTDPDLPLVRIGADGVARAWSLGVDRVRAVAVHASRVLLHGGPGTARHHAHLGVLGGRSVVRLRRVRIVDEGGRRLAPDRVEGRGRHLHLLCGTTWWRVDLATVPA